MATTMLPRDLRADVETLWAYHDVGHQPRRCDVGTGLGSHDLSVAGLRDLPEKVWPDVKVVYTSRPLPLDEYVATIGDVDRVITMLVGDTQPITEYARRGFAIEQPIPDDVTAAYHRLVDAGYTSRLI